MNDGIWDERFIVDNYIRICDLYQPHDEGKQKGKEFLKEKHFETLKIDGRWFEKMFENKDAVEKPETL